MLDNVDVTFTLDVSKRGIRRKQAESMARQSTSDPRLWPSDSLFVSKTSLQLQDFPNITSLRGTDLLLT